MKMSTIRSVPPPSSQKQKLRVEGSSSTQCLFSHRVCSQAKLPNYDFCLRHILEDKSSPYSQCNYVSNKRGKRCANATLKTERKDGYCAEHGNRILRNRQHRKRRPQETADTLLGALDHYVHSSKLTNGSSNGGRLSVASRALEYASSSDSDAECPLVENTWKGDGDSDAESVDSDQEDSLKHAGIYTAEEVALTTRDKLIRLQSLYIDQFKRLQNVMKDKRRNYLHQLKQEKDAIGNIHSTEEDPLERRRYENLQATKRYHKRFGKEALIHRQSKERRIAVSEGVNYKAPVFAKCIFQTDGPRGLKCGSRAVPLSKYCFMHIQHDPHQVLFGSCQFQGGACVRPVPRALSLCHLHSQPECLPLRYPRPPPSPPQEEDDEEDPRDESIDVVGNTSDVKFDLSTTSMEINFKSSRVQSDVKDEQKEEIMKNDEVK
ncbi:hypothetical protein CAPTEDRAFT_163655 [Capitella teleta]|uniref:KAT8 regulatory NSL complex subunit 2 n=1 Tax=Capitella teleta TaxID=283909 RepID=R7UCU0_CAPTE|nr:hypothetical protein CAPTEDRAFT_163655 [Capitella teleta]|eukprot:ELU01608.1 hypothetical protein CAPTEDRAFT_163655 [Capitella teleta]